MLPKPSSLSLLLMHASWTYSFETLQAQDQSVKLVQVRSQTYACARSALLISTGGKDMPDQMISKSQISTRKGISCSPSGSRLQRFCETQNDQQKVLACNI